MMNRLSIAVGVVALGLASASLSWAMADEPDPIPMFTTWYFANGQIVGTAVDRCAFPYTVVTDRTGIETSESISFPTGICGADPNNTP